MLLHASGLDRIGPGDRVCRPVHEPMPHDLRQAARAIPQEGEQACFPFVDAAGEVVETDTKLNGVAQDADMVEGRPMPGAQRSKHGERALEILEIRPGISVVGPEAREVDVGQVQQVIWFDPEEAVPPRMTRCVQHADPDPPEVEDVPVAEGHRVGTRDVVEILEEDAPELAEERLRVAIDRHHAIE